MARKPYRRKLFGVDVSYWLSTDALPACSTASCPSYCLAAINAGNENNGVIAVFHILAGKLVSDACGKVFDDNA